MSKMIQVRNVPDDVHRIVTERAAAAGLSLSDYIKRDLESAAAEPSIDEVRASIEARPTSGLRRSTVLDALAEARGR